MFEEMKCLKCGFIWNSRVDNPKACPYCKRYDWKEPRKEKTKKEVK